MDALPPAIYIILALAALATAGGLIAWVIGYIRGGDKGSPSKQSPTAKEQAGAKPPTLANEQELLRVLRTKKGGLAIFVQGQRYRHLREIKDPQMGREAIEGLKAVLAFAEGWLPTLRETPPQPDSKKPAVSAAPAVDEETFLEQLRRRDLFPSKEPSGLFGRPRRRKSPPTLEPLLTPADEIDNLVQQRLEKRPDLARHNIHLTTGEDRSLRIHVGLQTFTAVDDVPDPEVRVLIQDAIREWEGS